MLILSCDFEKFSYTFLSLHFFTSETLASGQCTQVLKLHRHNVNNTIASPPFLCQNMYDSEVVDAQMLHVSDDQWKLWNIPNLYINLFLTIPGHFNVALWDWPPKMSWILYSLQFWICFCNQNYESLHSSAKTLQYQIMRVVLVFGLVLWFQND